MNTTRIRIDPGDPATLPAGRIDGAKVDSTTETEIGLQQREDDAEAMQDAARYAPGSQAAGRSNAICRLAGRRPMTTQRPETGRQVEAALGEVLAHVRGETRLPCRVVDDPVAERLIARNRRRDCDEDRYRLHGMIDGHRCRKQRR